VNLLSLIPDFACAATVGLATCLYLLLITIPALTAIFTRNKPRRDAAKDVLRMLLPGRQRDRR